MSEPQPYTVDDARRAADQDALDTWVADFLASPGSDNAALAEELSDPPRSWIGPVRLSIHRLHRLAGPPGEPVLRPLDDDEWPERVDDMEQKIEEGWEPAPLVVIYRDAQLVLEDGNHRVESLRRAGEDEAWCVVGFEDPDDRDRFVAGSAGHLPDDADA